MSPKVQVRTWRQSGEALKRQWEMECMSLGVKHPPAQAHLPLIPASEQRIKLSPVGSARWGQDSHQGAGEAGVAATTVESQAQRAGPPRQVPWISGADTHGERGQRAQLQLRHRASCGFGRCLLCPPRRKTLDKNCGLRRSTHTHVCTVGGPLREPQGNLQPPTPYQCGSVPPATRRGQAPPK